MMSQKSGVIINISSAAGVSPAENLGPYCISKAAINMLTKTLALELGPYNIRVNAIAPRFVKTDFSQALWSNEKLMEQEYKQVPLKRIGHTRRNRPDRAVFGFLGSQLHDRPHPGPQRRSLFLTRPALGALF